MRILTRAIFFGVLTLAGSMTMSKSNAMSHMPAVPLTWAPPVARADGSQIPLSAISGYRVYRDDRLWTFTHRCSLMVFIGHCYRVATVDTDWRESPQSREVCV